ncbi:MAG: S8 family serine peptidase, partial [Candidatus Micrarchaeota archaeon]|nr:S8 family serine peptidase [Candidatus Micrarchaeota archaeon]
MKLNLPLMLIFAVALPLLLVELGELSAPGANQENSSLPGANSTNLSFTEPALESAGALLLNWTNSSSVEENSTNQTSSPYEKPYRVLSKGDRVAIETNDGFQLEIEPQLLSVLESEGKARVIVPIQSPIPEEVDELKVLPIAGIKVLQVEGEEDLASLAEAGVQSVQPDIEMEASLSDSIPLIGASLAHANYTGREVRICLLDTGVTPDESLQGRLIPGFNFINNSTNTDDDNGHGTLMAKVIAAVAPDAFIIPVKVLSSTGRGYSSDIIAGISYCQLVEADIISMSFGGGEYENNCDSDAVASRANEASAGGIIAVASAGNRGLPNITSPACGSGVIAVSSSSKQDEVSPFSNINPLVSLLAPGEGINIGGQARSGTSISAAHLAGAAALLLESNSSLSPQEALYRFQTTGKPIEHGGRNYSRLDVYSAILNIPSGLPPFSANNTTNETGNYTYETHAVYCNENLNTPNTVYLMTGDCYANGTNGLNITAQNVTLDCQGYSIIGNNSSGTYGVYTDKQSTTIRNCRISLFDRSIFSTGSYTTIDRLNSTFAKVNHVSLGGQGAIIENSTISENANLVYGVYLTGAYSSARNLQLWGKRDMIFWTNGNYINSTNITVWHTTPFHNSGMGSVSFQGQYGNH